MDAKTVKRIDSLYRNINSFLLLIILSLFIPLFLLFAVPLSLAYLYLRAKLLKDVDSGKILFDPYEEVASGGKDNLTTEQKVEFIRKNSSRLWAPIVIFFVLAAIIATVVLLPL
jgi:hypothetical protein